MTLCPPCGYPDCSLCNGRSPGNPRCATALAESLRRVDPLWTPYVEWRRGQPFAPDPRPTDAFEAGYVRGQEDLLAAWRRTARPVDPTGTQVVDSKPDDAAKARVVELERRLATAESDLRDARASAGYLLRGSSWPMELLDQALLTHPWPWRACQDWTWEVVDADAATVCKCMTHEAAAAVVSIAGLRHAEREADAAEVEGFLRSHGVDDDGFPPSGAV